MPGKDRDEESGKYTTTYTDSDFIEAIGNGDGMAATSDVAESVGCSHQTAYERLQRLEEQGEIRSREVGNSLLWSTVDE
jgi:Mn-dependent DtxR family transcriptional regulator